MFAFIKISKGIHMKKISEIMTKNLITVYATQNLESAYVKLKLNGIRHFPVLNSSNEVIGIISDRDFQRAMVSNSSTDFEFLPNDTVEDYMSSPIKTVKKDDDLLTVVKKMLDHQISSVLISDNSQLVGIITHEDLLLLLADILRNQKPSTLERVESWISHTPVNDIAVKLSNVGI